MAATVTKPSNGQTLTSTMGGRAVDMLAGIPFQTEYSPPPPEQACILLLGLRGQFKSSFCMSNPDAVVFDWEDGCSAVINRKARPVPMVPSVGSGVPTEWLKLTPWERYERTRDALLKAAQAGKPPCKTVVFDTLDAFMDTILQRFCKEKNVESPGDYGASAKGSKGWYLVRDIFMNEFRLFRAAGYGVWISAHLRTKHMQKDGNDVTYVEPWVQESVRGMLFREVHQILTIESLALKEKVLDEKVIAGKTVSVPREVERRVVRLRTIPQARNTDVKTRVHIPDKLELDLDNLCGNYFKAYQEEVERVKKLNK